MEQFNRFYLWGVNTKYRMGLYFAAAVSFKGLVNALLGLWMVDTLILLEMLLCLCLSGDRHLPPWEKPAGREKTGGPLGRAGQCDFPLLRLDAALVPRYPPVGRSCAGPLSGELPGGHVVRPVAEGEAGHRRFESGPAAVSGGRIEKFSVLG